VVFLVQVFSIDFEGIWGMGVARITVHSIGIALGSCTILLSFAADLMVEYVDMSCPCLLLKHLLNLLVVVRSDSVTFVEIFSAQASLLVDQSKGIGVQFHALTSGIIHSCFLSDSRSATHHFDMAFSTLFGISLLLLLRSVVKVYKRSSSVVSVVAEACLDISHYINYFE
jgi:hypothetical protein